MTSPNRCEGYWFCTMTVKELMLMPSPRPMTTMFTASFAEEVVTPMSESRKAPRVTQAKPPTTSHL